MKKAATMAVATSQLVWLHLSPLARLGSQLGQSGTDPSPTAIIRRAVENTENTTKNNTKYEKMLETMTIFSPQAKTLTTKCRQMYHKFSYNFPAVLEKPQHSWGFGFSVFFSLFHFFFWFLLDFWETFESVAMQVPPNTCSCKQKQQQQWSLVVNFSQVTASFVQYCEAGFLLFDFSFYDFRGVFHSLTCRDRCQVQAGKCLESLTFLAVLWYFSYFFFYLCVLFWAFGSHLSFCSWDDN